MFELFITVTAVVLAIFAVIGMVVTAFAAFWVAEERREQKKLKAILPKKPEGSA